MAIGGLDIGTTGCKITLYDDNGTYLYKAYRDYPVSRSVGEHEVKAEYIWEAVKEVMKEASVEIPDIRGIGITSFGETFVLLDEDDKPLCPSMLYTDPRGAQECEELIDKLGEMEIARITGLKPHMMYSISKLMWVKNNKPEYFQKVRHIFLMEDYVVYMLTGQAQIDYSLATRTMAFDIRKLCWSKEILKAAGIDEGLLSKTVPTGTSAGVMKQSMAEGMGLSNETIVVSVSHDQVAAAIGSNVCSDDVAVDGAGTVECITPVFTGIPDNDLLYKGNYAIVPYIIPNHYLCYAFSYTGGALIQWYIDNLAGYEKILAGGWNCSVHEVLEQGMTDKPTGLLVLPHFAGAATPYMDSDSKGAIVGLTLSHTASDIYRALMEGVTYEMLLNMDELNKAGIKFKMLRATGGGANSKVWMQMKADILNIPLVSLGSGEAGAAGCVMLTGVATGVFPNLEAAAGLMVSEIETYYPRQEQHDAYMKVYERYKKLYHAVRDLV